MVSTNLTLTPCLPPGAALGHIKAASGSQSAHRMKRSRDTPHPPTPACPQVLILGAQKGTEWELDAGLRAFLNTQDPQRSLLRLLSANSALRVDEYAAAQGAAPGELLCFRVRAVGPGVWGCGGPVDLLSVHVC